VDRNVENSDACNPDNHLRSPIYYILGTMLSFRTDVTILDNLGTVVKIIMRSAEDSYCSLGCTIKNGRPARHQAYGARCRRKNMVPTTSVEQGPGILDQTSQRYQKEIKVRSSVARSPGSQFVDDSMLPSNSEFGDSELPSIELLVNDLRCTQAQPLVILPPCHKSIIV
jgi:hypothetical protein